MVATTKYNTNKICSEFRIQFRRCDFVNSKELVLSYMT